MPPDTNGEPWVWIVVAEGIGRPLALIEIPASKSPLTIPALLSVPIPFRRACVFVQAGRDGLALRKWDPYLITTPANAVGVMRVALALPAHEASVANARRCWGENVVEPAPPEAGRILKLHGR